MLRGDFQPPKRTRKNIIIFSCVGLAGLSGAFLTIAAATFVISAWLGLPLSVFGLNEGPDQPISFPHTVHVQEIGMDCTFCHRNVTSGATASIPSVALCMTCHRVIGDSLPEVEKLRKYHENEEPINWVRVHRTPDHVNFVHEAHVRFFSKKNDVVAAATCSICHGDVGSMLKVSQIRSLKMGDCVDCHKQNSAPTDCSTCHY